MADLIVLKNRANPHLTRIFPKRSWDFQHESGELKRNWEYSHNLNAQDNQPPKSEIQRQMIAAKNNRESFIPTEVKALEEKLKSKANANLQNPSKENGTRTDHNRGRPENITETGMGQAVRDNAPSEPGEGAISAAGSEGQVQPGQGEAEPSGVQPVEISDQPNGQPAPKKRGRPPGKAKTQA